MFHKVIFNLYKYLQNIFFARYAIHKIEIIDSGMIYIQYISLLTNKVLTVRIDELFANDRLLNKFPKSDCIKLGFLGFGKIFLTKDNITLSEIKNYFDEIVDKINNS